MTVDQYVRAYRQLSQEVHDAGLMRHHYGFYWTRIIG